MAEHRDDPADQTRTTGEPVRSDRTEGGRTSGDPGRRDPADQTRTTGEPVHRDHAVAPEDRREVVGREREEHGGVKIGSAFFGWLSATGMIVLLSGLVAATGVLAGQSSGADSAGEAASALDVGMETVGVLGIVLVLVIWFLAYFSGGYVAGRMARFDGIKQGVAVWGWSIVVGIVLAVVAAVAGSDYTGYQGVPDLSLGETTTTTLIVLAVGVLVASLVGAMLGGLTGMRFHRRVDRTGLGR